MRIYEYLAPHLRHVRGHRSDHVSVKLHSVQSVQAGGHFPAESLISHPGSPERICADTAMGLVSIPPLLILRCIVALILVGLQLDS